MIPRRWLLALGIFTATNVVHASDRQFSPQDWKLESVNAETGRCKFSHAQEPFFFLYASRAQTGITAMQMSEKLDNAKKDAESYLAGRGVHTSLNPAFSYSFDRSGTPPALDFAQDVVYWQVASNSMAFVFGKQLLTYTVVALADDPQHSYTLELDYFPPIDQRRDLEVSLSTKKDMHHAMRTALGALEIFDRCTRD